MTVSAVEGIEKLIRSISRFAVARPKFVLVVTAIVVSILGVIGLQAESRMHPTQLYVQGTDTYKAFELTGDSYGEAIALVVSGDKDSVDTQGKALALALTKRDRTKVISPWSGGGAAKQLRPSETKAVLLVDLRRGPGETVSTAIPPLKEFVGAHIKPPLTFSVTGVTEVGRAYNDTIMNSIRQAELIAVPALLIVLILVLRTPLASAIPVLIALGTLMSGNGIVRILTNWMELDAVTLNMVSMIGLAIGVDYSLLLVSRFREALDDGQTPEQAALTAANTAGRTAAFAGVMLLALMSVVVFVAPGSAMLSSAVGSIVVTCLGVLGALVVTPAAVRLIGHKINSWPLIPFKKKQQPGGGFTRLVDSVTKHPVRSLVLAGALCGLASLPGLFMKMIPPDPRQLPPSSAELQNFYKLREVGMGPEITVVMKSNDGPLTAPAKLHTVGALQEQIKGIKYVNFVAGPADIGEQTKQVGKIGTQLRSVRTQLADGKTQLTELSDGLKRAKGGVEKLRAGLITAADGSSRIKAGTSEAASGSGKLAAGAGQATGGAKQVADGTSTVRNSMSELSEGLAAAASGASRLADGARTAAKSSSRLHKGTKQLDQAIKTQILPGANQLAQGLEAGAADLSKLREPAQIIEKESKAALDALNRMTVGKVDPAFFDAYKSVATAVGASSGKNPINGESVSPGYTGLDNSLALAVGKTKEAAEGAKKLSDGLTQVSAGTSKLEDGSRRLTVGLKQLRDGQLKLEAGVSQIKTEVSSKAPDLQRLEAGAAALEQGMQQLQAGANRLTTGLGQLDQAQGQLARGLGEAPGQTAPLVAGLSSAVTGVDKFGRKLDSNSGATAQLEQLDKQSPGFFKSGFLRAAAADGAPPLSRDAAAGFIDLAGGANLGRIIILPDLPTNDPRTKQLVDSVRQVVNKWNQQTGFTAYVGGGASQMTDFERTTKGRLPFLLFGMSFVTFLLLAVVLRSIYLPILAVVLNLVTVGISTGVLTLLFSGENPILGGAGSLDVLMVSAVVSVTFALSIDYQVFLLSRMREGYMLTGTTAGSIEYGVSRTAAVVTSAAAIMVAAFLAFGFAEFAAVKQMGIGLSVAVFVDATIVRLVLLPAAMTLLGERTWWFPEWLDKRVPVVDPEGLVHEHAELPAH